MLPSWFSFNNAMRLCTKTCCPVLCFNYQVCHVNRHLTVRIHIRTRYVTVPITDHVTEL